MIRIDVVSQTQKQVVLKVEGRLGGIDVNLLEEEVTRWLEETEHLVLDLKNVQFIDRDGIALLKKWSQEPLNQGNESGRPLTLKSGSLFIRSLLKTHGLTVL